MKLNLRKKEECLFDEISLGEVMLRLDPGEEELKPPAALRLGRAAVNTTLQEGFAAASR